jgi:hypothetical protein
MDNSVEIEPTDAALPIAAMVEDDTAPAAA